MWPLWQAKLWIIDDHGIVALHSAMEKNGHDFLEPFRFVLSKQLSNWGKSSWYRPFTDLSLALRTYFFGTNARLLFLWNFFVFFVSIVCIGLSLHYFYPPPFVLLGMLFFASLPSYADIWGRLGPSDIEGCLWTALFLYGLSGYVKNKSFGWPVLCLSAFIATGCKEPFIILMLPLTVILVHSIWQRRCSGARQLFFFLFPLSMISFVWGSFFTYFSRLPEPMDMYGQSVSLFARARVAFSFFYEGPRAVIVAAAFLLFYTCWSLAKDKMEDTKKTFAAMAVISLCILGNFVLYNGYIPLVSRYGYMDQLLLIMLFFAALFPLRRTLTDAWLENALFRRHLLRWSWALGLVSVFMILGLMRVNAFRAARTLEFNDFMNRLKSYENVQVVNLGQAVSSHEPYYSLRSFSKAGWIPEVYYFPAWAEPENAFQKSLQDSLMRDAALEPAPPLTPNTALAEFGPNGWFRFIEHTSPSRDIEQTLLMSGWSENIGYLGKFLGRTPAKGRRSSGERMTLALPVGKIQAYKIVVHATPFNAKDLESDVVFYCNGTEVKKAKLKDYGEGYAFEVSEETVRNSPLHPNLIQLEARIENADLEHLNGLTFYSIDILPLP
jgi:hypothetical protein